MGLYEPAITNVETRYRGYLCFKRFQDMALSILALIVLSPFLLLISLAIVIDDPKGGPIFSQTRVGKNGRLFPIYKFRTMKADAKSPGGMLSPEELFEYRKEFKLNQDPRVTRMGNFLRRSSIDEIPQLVNIVLGHMSLIGPRPLLPEEVQEKYTEPEQRLLLSLRPGLTGLWQVKGRSQCTYESGERQKAELYYVQNYSPRLDFTILLHTVRAIVKGDGVM